MILFTDECQQALSAVEVEIQRFMDWLENDQLRYWQMTSRKLENKVTECKAELTRKRLMAMRGDPPQISEEMAQLKKFQRRLEEAQEKVKKCRLWAEHCERAINEYKASVQQLTVTMEADIPKAVGLLDRHMTRLQEYVSMQAGEMAGATDGGQQSMAREVDDPDEEDSA